MSVVLEFQAAGKAVLRGQAHMWSVLREKGAGALFTTGDIDRHGNDRHLANSGDFCRRLVAAGIAVLDHQHDQGRGGTKQNVYRLLKTPRTLPPLNRSGKPPRQHVGQQYMWNVLRKGGVWTARDLAAFASTDEVTISRDTATSYLYRLRLSGYLVTVEEPRSRSQGHYRLNPSRDTGPTAPMILRSKLVFDPNSDEVPGAIEAEVAS